MLEVPLTLAVLSIASAYDLRDRTIPDWIWLVGVISGLILRLIDWRGTLTYLRTAYPYLALLGVLLLLEWGFSLSGEADVLAYATLMVTATAPLNPLPAPFLSYLLSKLLVMLTMPVQFLLNLLRVTKRPDLLRGFDEPLWRRILALLLLTPYSRHLSVGARVAEVEVNGRRRFILSAALSPIEEGEVDETEAEGKWIAPTYPMIPFILSGYVLILLFF